MGNEIDDQCVSIKSEYTSDIVDGEPVEITGEEDGYLVVDRPSEDSIPAPRILFPVGKIGASTDNPYGFARAGTTPIWVSYTGDDPAIGDEVGTVADSFDFAVSNSGFMCVGVDAANSKCLVRPNSGSGSGASTTVPAKVTGKSGAFHTVKLYPNGVDSTPTSTVSVYVMQLNFADTLPVGTWIIVNLSAIGAVGSGVVL